MTMFCPIFSFFFFFPPSLSRSHFASFPSCLLAYLFCPSCFVFLRFLFFFFQKKINSMSDTELMKSPPPAQSHICMYIPVIYQSTNLRPPRNRSNNSLAQPIPPATSLSTVDNLPAQLGDGDGEAQNFSSFSPHAYTHSAHAQHHRCVTIAKVIGRVSLVFPPPGLPITIPLTHPNGLPPKDLLIIYPYVCDYSIYTPQCSTIVCKS